MRNCPLSVKLLPESLSLASTLKAFGGSLSLMLFPLSLPVVSVTICDSYIILDKTQNHDKNYHYLEIFSTL